MIRQRQRSHHVMSRPVNSNKTGTLGADKRPDLWVKPR